MPKLIGSLITPSIQLIAGILISLGFHVLAILGVTGVIDLSQSGTRLFVLIATAVVALIAIILTIYTASRSSRSRTLKRSVEYMSSFIGALGYTSIAIVLAILQFTLTAPDAFSPAVNPANYAALLVAMGLLWSLSFQWICAVLFQTILISE